MARHDMVTLRAAVNLYAKEYGLDTTPRFTLPPEGPPRNRWLTRKEAADLLRAARRAKLPHLVRFILVSLYTGTRSSVVLGLQWIPNTTDGWVDLEKNRIYREPFGRAQTNKRKPPIAIPRKLRGHLNRWQAIDGDVQFLITFRGNKCKRVSKSFTTIRDKAGLDKEVIPHILRHTSITWAMQAGVDVHEVAGFYGVTLEVLQNVYWHHHPEFQKAVSEAL